VSCTGGKFAASVVYTGGNLPPGLLTPLANLPPVSLTLVANLPPVSTTPAELAAKLPPVSLIPMVHLDLRISPRIFEKIRNDPSVIFRAWGNDS
jgi:hypothetical protein